MLYHSDASGYTPSRPKTIYDLEKGNHRLALPKGSLCEILTAFKVADRQSGNTGVFIDPIMCKSYKGLAPLPCVVFCIIHSLLLIQYFQNSDL